MLPIVAKLKSKLAHSGLNEPWGLVVNEAIASRLPVLLSRQCGCYPELLDEGKTGWGFSPDSLEEMTAQMIDFPMDHSHAVHPECFEQVLERFTPACFGRGLMDAVKSAFLR